MTARVLYLRPDQRILQRCQRMHSADEARLSQIGTFIRATRTISLVASDIKDCALEMASVIIPPMRVCVKHLYGNICWMIFMRACIGVLALELLKR